MALRMGLHTALSGASPRFQEVSAALGADLFLWIALTPTGPNRPQDALARPNGTHILRIPTPMPDEHPDDWMRHIIPILDPWVSAGIPPGALIVQPGNEPDTQGVDVPVPWSIPAWFADAHSYRDALRGRYPNLPLLAPPLTSINTPEINADYLSGYDAAAIHCYWAEGNPGWRQGRDGGQAWRCATDLGVPCYVTEINSNPTSTNEILAWASEVDSPLMLGGCLFGPDAAGTEFGMYDVTVAEAAAIREGLVAQPIPPTPEPPSPPTPEPPVTNYGFSAVSEDQFAGMVHDGSLPGTTSPFLTQYSDITGAAQQSNLDVRVLLAWTRSENHQATDISDSLLAAHNAAGIYYVGQSRATPGPLGPAGEGSKPYCAFATWTDFWLTLADNIHYVLGVAGGDLNRAAWYYTLGNIGFAHADAGEVHPKARYYDEYMTNYPPDGSIQPQPTGPTLADILRVARAHIGNDRTDEGNPEFGMCEQFIEEVVEEVTGNRIRYPTAAAHAAVLQRNGAFGTTWPPPPGATLWWIPPFDPSGHTCFADEYPLVITTYRDSDPNTIDVISRIDANANGWYRAMGFVGWSIPQGVVEGVIEKGAIDMLVETGFDPGILKRQWDGPKTAAQIKKAGGYDANRGIDQKWATELQAGRPLGFAISNEESDPASGRVVRFFSNGRITYFPADGSMKVN